MMYDTTPKTRRRYCPVSIACVILGGALALAGDWINVHVTHVGLVMLFLAATYLVTIRTGVNAEVIEHARQVGYDVGYLDGQTVQPAPPVELRRVI